MSSFDPARHDDGRRYATFFDIPHECRDLCYIEFLQTFCGDGICRPDKSRPAVDGAAPIRGLNKRICAEFDALVCMWVRGIQCTLNRFAVQQKRGSTCCISYELPTFAAGDGTKLIGFSNEISFVARRYGLPVPSTTWAYARQARALPSDAYSVTPSASARELSNIINAVSDYNLRIHEAQIRAGFRPRGQPRRSTREEFDAGMEALRRSRIIDAGWTVEYARIRTPAR
ncbi:hypothetical protein LTR95_011765 [Oleoguttula sp. CCFEE 5521]